MPRYYFDVEGVPGTVRDTVGQDLPGPGAARAEAVAVLSLLASSVLAGREAHRISISVHADGAPLFVTSLRLETEWA